MSYSRRQLYALGETLGDSATRKKAGGGMIYGGGGSSSPQPTTSTTNTSNIPTYAQPYVENMLGATQNQLFNTTTDASGNTTLNGFKPYTPYSTNMQDYFAPQSGLQTQAYNTAQGLTTPDQFAQGSGLAGMAGIGGLTAGSNFQNMATNPGAVQSYMSPYIQASLNPQLAEIQRQYGITGAQEQANATGAGAFGGSREALMAAENNRNMNTAMNQAIGQGYNTAFTNAQNQMQFGANLGLQGINAANTAAGTLGQLGASANQANINDINLQNTLGTQAQQYQQGMYNQAIQNYATQQQYPLMELGFMSNMLRGLPLQASTTQTYQAAPTVGQQALGLAGAGASLYGATKAKGGTIKEKKFAVGGIAQATIDKTSDIPTLQKLLAEAKSPTEQQMIKERIAGLAAANSGSLGTNMASGGIIPRFDGEVDSLVSETPQRSYGEGLDEADVKKSDIDQVKKYGKLADQLDRAAFVNSVSRQYPAENQGEFIAPSATAPAAAPAAVNASKNVAPATDKVVQATEKAPAKAPTKGLPAALNAGKQPAGDSVEAELANRKRILGLSDVGEKNQALMSKLEAAAANASSQNEQDRYLRMAEAFATFGSTAAPGGMLTAVNKGLGQFATGEAAARKEQQKAELENTKMQADLEEGRRAQARGDYDAAQKAFDSAAGRQKDIQVANITAQAHLGAAGAASKAEQGYIQELQAKGYTLEQALQIVKGAGRAEGLDVQRAKAALASIDNQLLMTKKGTPQYDALQQQRNEVIKSLSQSGPQAPAAAPAATGDIPSVSSQAEYDKLQPGQQYRDPQGQLRVKG